MQTQSTVESLILFMDFVVPSNLFWIGITTEQRIKEFYNAAVMYFKYFVETLFTTNKEGYK